MELKQMGNKEIKFHELWKYPLFVAQIRAFMILGMCVGIVYKNYFLTAVTLGVFFFYDFLILNNVSQMNRKTK